MSCINATSYMHIGLCGAPTLQTVVSFHTRLSSRSIRSSQPSDIMDNATHAPKSELSSLLY